MINDVPTTQGGGSGDQCKATTSRLWAGVKNPRIVRVSRAFGGKDRHSKVSTIRGLRDRRVRLSIPTALQLYDLQDKLGLNQPSKAVDWLLNAARKEIDKLPPLQLPSGNFAQFPQSLAVSHGATSTLKNMRDDVAADQETFLTFWNSDGIQRAKQQSESYYHWEPSTTQMEAAPTSIQSSLSLMPNGYSQLMMLPSYVAASTDFDAREFNQFQMAASASNLQSNTMRTYQYLNLSNSYNNSQNHHES